MTDSYELVLGQEIATWEVVTVVARQQRQAIVTRHAQHVDDLRDGLREALRMALLAHHQTLQARPVAAAARCTAREADVDRAQLAARDAIRLNVELVRDTCSHLKTGRGATTPNGYVPTRRPRVVALAASRQVA